MIQSAETYFGAQFHGGESPWSGHRVMFRRLRKLTLGHAMLLEWLESPFVTAERGPGPADCALVIMMCSRSVERAERLCRSRWVRWHLRRFMPLRFQFSVTVFGIVNYLEAYSATPRCWHGAGGRESGTPFLQGVKVTHMANLNRTESEALALPLPLAVHDYAAYWDLQGTVKIVNAQEEAAMEAARAMAEAAPGRN